MLCARCGSPLLPVDDTSPAFCAACGLPQLRMAEDAVAPQREGQPNDRSFVAGAGPVIHWPHALRSLLPAAVLGATIPTLLPGAITGGLLGGLAMLLMPLLTFAVLTLYSRSHPQRRLTSSIGLRLGSTLGILTGALIALLTGAVGFALRYGYRSHRMDDTLQQTTGQLPAQLAAGGAPVPPELLLLVRSPQFRAGTFILSHVFTTLLLAAVGSVCGWAAGKLLHNRERRHRGD